MKIQCVIIDDEPSSQNILKHLIGDVDFLEIAGICNDAVDAMTFLKETKVDLLFLDINMPNLSGIAFYKMLKNPPLVIFTTAYSEYAIEGFDVNAIDYLLKPFSFERFLKAVQKVKNKLVLEKEFIIIKSDKKLYQLKVNDILFVEALGDYIKIYTKDKVLVSYKTLRNILSLLPDNKYMQIHKSYIINQSKLDFVEGNQVTIGSKKIPIGQKFKINFLKRLNS
ncbi:DNA-binding response regulator, LytR/AlgR family [Tenacibaculum sp. MAR_2010_89]|uniref:LytR/AlgR family response regulator transcription factor n=1 Tax=Tenacibaculum sp. MAR_2010_89 TaxID=1250198 RepID=UPI00089D28BB|nr:LytTR family DNA-binding domain-containing protein [Tenacibaculum sp. MAR_2010_89]SED98055.1 DNA-binding response regulator, LytR/AlgR family [Tenacibaculum sp. MAR_2010_89]